MNIYLNAANEAINLPHDFATENVARALRVAQHVTTLPRTTKANHNPQPENAAFILEPVPCIRVMPAFEDCMQTCMLIAHYSRLKLAALTLDNEHNGPFQDGLQIEAKAKEARTQDRRLQDAPETRQPHQ